MPRFKLLIPLIVILTLIQLLMGQERIIHSQIIHLNTGQYLVIDETKVSLWRNFGDWSKSSQQRVGQFRKNPADKIWVNGLTIYRYGVGRQVITVYDKSLNPVESTPLSALRIDAAITVFAVSVWGDYWIITSNGEGKLILANGSKALPIKLSADEVPETFIAFPETMALVTRQSIVVFDLFGNQLITFPRPEAASQLAAYTRDTMLFWDAIFQQITALGTRPSIHMTFATPDKPITLITDPNTNTVSFWPPVNGSTVLSPRNH